MKDYSLYCPCDVLDKERTLQLLMKGINILSDAQQKMPRFGDHGGFDEYIENAFAQIIKTFAEQYLETYELAPIDH